MVYTFLYLEVDGILNFGEGVGPSKFERRGCLRAVYCVVEFLFSQQLAELEAFSFQLVCVLVRLVILC